MAIALFNFAGGGVNVAELQRVVDPTLTVTQTGFGSVVVVTTDSSNFEALSEAMAAQGFSFSSATQPRYRHTLDGWSAVGVAAGLVALPLPRWTLSTVAQALVLRPGRLTGISVLSTLAASGSALTLTAFVNGVPSALSVDLVVGATQALNVTGSVAVIAGDLVDLRTSTGLLWASLLANLSGQLELED